MSSFYEMSVEVSGYDPAKVAEIQAAAEQEWPLTTGGVLATRTTARQRCTHLGRTHCAEAKAKKSLPSGCPWQFGAPTAGIATFLLTPLTWKISPTKRTSWTKQITPA